jgi:Zn ribbon nucleic-acid-binding protein
MNENNTLHLSDLEKVAGGVDTAFYNGVPICPVCGERPIKMVSSDEFVDTYQCHVCGSTSIHTKKLRPEAPKPHPDKVCPQCGSLGKWRILRTEGIIDYVECTVCRLQSTAPADQRYR